MATGLLIICVGKATKVVDRYQHYLVANFLFFISYMDVYQFAFCLDLSLKRLHVLYLSV